MRDDGAYHLFMHSDFEGSMDFMQVKNQSKIWSYNLVT